MSTLAKPAPVVVALSELESLAQIYAKARALVAERVDIADEEVRTIYRRRLGGIKGAIAIANDAQARLVAAIQAHPELFTQPRTMTLHGIKFGFKKGSGKVEWEVEDEVLVARIEKMFPAEEAELLIATTKAPLKDALKNLDAKQLAKLGVTMEGTGDVVVVKATDSDTDKLVKKMLKEGAIEDAEEGAGS